MDSDSENGGFSSPSQRFRTVMAISGYLRYGPLITRLDCLSRTWTGRKGLWAGEPLARAYG